MSTFLELAQDLHRESGAGGSAPSTVTGQTGESLRIVNWVKQADLAISRLHFDWQFLWSQGSITTASGTSTYAGPDDINHYDLETFRLGGEVLPAMMYLDTRGEVISTTDTNQPYRAVILPNKQVRFDEIPNATYSVTFDYYKVPSVLAADADESDIPEPYRPVILAQALVYYARYESAPEIEAQGVDLLATYIEMLEADQLPGDRYMHGTAEGNNIVIVPQ